MDEVDDPHNLNSDLVDEKHTFIVNSAEGNIKLDTEKKITINEHHVENEKTKDAAHEKEIITDRTDGEQEYESEEDYVKPTEHEKEQFNTQLENLQDWRVVKSEESDSIKDVELNELQANKDTKEDEYNIVEIQQTEDLEQKSSEEEVDPAAPLNLRHSVEDLRRPYKLPQEVEDEVQTLWQTFQNCTPAYSHIDKYITLMELPYMLKSILLMTHTPMQLMELVDFICIPVTDENKELQITYEQFLAIVKMRHRVFDVEEELRGALDILDPKKTGQVDREKLKEMLGTLGHKMSSKMIHKFVKEVDLAGDGIIGIEDIVAICGIELPPRETSAEKYNTKSTEVIDETKENDTERGSIVTAAVTSVTTNVSSTTIITEIL